MSSFLMGDTSLAMSRESSWKREVSAAVLGALGFLSLAGNQTEGTEKCRTRCYRPRQVLAGVSQSAVSSIQPAVFHLKAEIKLETKDLDFI